MTRVAPSFAGDCEGCDSGDAALCSDCANAEVAQQVQDWLDKQRCTPSGLTPAEISVLERCIEDLR